MAKGSTRRSSDQPVRQIRPALSPEARENQMIALAEALAEKQLLDGTASQAIITHYLKLGTIKYQHELEKLRNENELLKVKSESIAKSGHMEELMQAALNAFRKYSGYSEDDEDTFDD
ncbi:MAG: hypothetical protein IJ716_14410 [Lachnospiraceae bacterium]|nr:hypothetical protein [Lachnospiraceae bacterium]